MPHLSLLGFIAEALSTVYTSTAASHSVQKAGPANKPAGNDAITENLRWHESWNAYVRGNIITESAAKLIQSFLLKTLTGADTGDRDADSEEEASENDNSLPALRVTSSNLKKLLTAAPVAEEGSDGSNDENKSLGGRLRVTSRKTLLQKQYVSSMRLCENIWSSQTTTLPAGTRTMPGHMYIDTVEEHKAARGAIRKELTKHIGPFDRTECCCSLGIFQNGSHFG